MYSDSFGAEHIPKENEKFIGNKNIITNIYRIQTCNLITCGYFSIGFIDFTLKGKSLLNYTSLFSPNEYEKNDKIFSVTKKLKWKKSIALSVVSIKNLKLPKYHTFSKKH